MSFCKSCGAVLGVGRFCTNCGAAVVQSSASHADHAEAPAERTNIRLPAVQPDAATGTRFPLFADGPASSSPIAADSEMPTEARSVPRDAVAAGAVFETTFPAQSYHSPFAPGHGSGAHAATDAGAAPVEQGFVPPVAGSQAAFGAATWQPAPHPAPSAPSGGSHRSGDERGRKVFWIVPLVLALVATLCLGIWLGQRGGDDDVTGTADQGSPTPTPSSSESASPSTSPTPRAAADSGAPPVDLTDQVSATGPQPIKPGVDLAGNPVTYPVENVLDGKAETAYRMPGDSSGKSITLTLPGETSVLEVGVINGYAKKDESGGRTVDWYTRNRRILAVEWIFDDGTSVSQKLSETKEMQVLAVNNIRSAKVIMRIVDVSKKPTGELAKDVTAISEVVVRGRPAS